MKKLLLLVLTCCFIISLSACENKEQEEDEEVCMAFYKAYSIPELFAGWKQARTLNGMDMEIGQIEDEDLQLMYQNEMHEIEELLAPEISLENYYLDSIYITRGGITYNFGEKDPETEGWISHSLLRVNFSRVFSDSEDDFYATTLEDFFIIDGDLILDKSLNRLIIDNNGYQILVDFPDDIVYATPKEAFEFITEAITWTCYTLEDLEEMTFETE